jgi:hypothetical protein
MAPVNLGKMPWLRQLVGQNAIDPSSSCGYTELFNLSVLEGRSDLRNFLRSLFGG